MVRNKKFLFLVSLACVSLLGIFIGRSLSSSKLEVGVVSVRSAADENIRFAPAPEVLATNNKRISVAASYDSTQLKPVKFEFQNELDEYSKLSVVALPTAEQRQSRATLLTNSRLIKAIGLRLLKQPLMDLNEQDVAVDMLLDALKNGDKQAAEEALRSIASDSQVEDGAIASSVREQMAGIKAEVLNSWSAMVPSSMASIGSMLPGPISQKIWQNVLDHQANNEAESRSLAH